MATKGFSGRRIRRLAPLQFLYSVRVNRVSFLMVIILPGILFPNGIALAEDDFKQSTKEQSLAQTAEILGTGEELKKLLTMRQRSNLTESESKELFENRVGFLQKILLGYLDLRSACSRIDAELAYTYELSQRHQQKVDTINQLLNFSNFVQAGTLYTIEGRSKLHHQDKQSYILTTLGAGLSAALPATNILYGKYNKTGKLAPPASLKHVLDGGPVNESILPESIKKFLDYSEAGQNVSRRMRLAAIWKQRYKADLSNEASLCALTNAHSASPSLLKKRIVLLWSLRTFIQDFDYELLSLLEAVNDATISSATEKNPGTSMLPAKIAATAKLLRVERQTELVAAIRQSGSSEGRLDEPEIELLSQVLRGLISTQTAIDKVDNELNYAYDVVLSQLLSKRSKVQQRITEANFISKGTLNAIGGLLDLSEYTKAADMVFVTANSIGLGLTSLALAKLGGEKRKVDTPENSLSEIFGLEPLSERRIPALVMQFLNSPDPHDLNGKTRKETLFEVWRRNRVSRLNPNNRRAQEKLAALSQENYDTIQLVIDRISLLQSLRARVSTLNSEISELLVSTENRANTDNALYVSSPNRLSNSARATATLLEMQVQMSAADDVIPKARPLMESPALQKLALLRRVLSKTLELRKTASNIELEIAKETQALNRMKRLKDAAVLLTNNLNFYQGYILGTILYGPLGLSGSHKNAIASDRLKIIAGFLSIGLGLASLIEQHGGVRLKSVEPNMLGPCFDLKSKAEEKYSPTVWRYLNSASPSSSDEKTRKEILIAYWRDSGILNLKSKSMMENISGSGRSHRKINETIALAGKRISMLYDLKAVVNLMDMGLRDLMRDLSARD